MGNFSGSGVQNFGYTQPEVQGRVNKPFNFYKNQCRVLESQLSLAEKILNIEIPLDDVTSIFLFCPKSALTELRQLLKVGKTLIEDCREVPCLKAYLRQGARTQAFTKMLKEIFWCRSVAFYYISKRKFSEDSIAMNEFPQMNYE